METTIVRYLNMGFDYFAAFILSLVLLCCVLEKSKTMLLKIYICMAASCVISLLLEAVSITFAFSDHLGDDMLRTLLNNVSVVCGYGLAFFYTCYVANLVGPKSKMCRLTVNLLWIIGIIAVCALVWGNLSGSFFAIKNSRITPGRLFVYTFAFDIIACLAGILLIIVHGRNLNKRDVIALFSLPILIFVSAALQYILLKMMYGLFTMAAVSLFIIYLMIQTDRNKRNIEQEKQLVDMNIAMMLSQIQPHFLYNALSSIRRLIKKNPDMAETAVENFSTYLRQNLESMSRVEPVPFSKELQHVEEYLYLEKLRFGERLQVEYDIAYNDFVMPLLTLQPIVENAVKHGIMRKEDGGLIRIATSREKAKVIITVSDNGVGFLPSASLSADRLHIGLANVEQRIRAQCKGMLSVESEPGVGTTVTMTLPMV